MLFRLPTSRPTRRRKPSPACPTRTPTATMPPSISSTASPRLPGAGRIVPALVGGRKRRGVRRVIA